MVRAAVHHGSGGPHHEPEARVPPAGPPEGRFVSVLITVQTAGLVRITSTSEYVALSSSKVLRIVRPAKAEGSK